MSFQDFTSGRSRTAGGGGNRSGLGMGNSDASSNVNTSAIGGDGRSGDGYANVSRGILQYQQNVGILGKIIDKVGSKEDGPLLDQQYKLQIDVIAQLGSKILSQLDSQSQLLDKMTRTDAAKRRATQQKLTRDYRLVETTYKNLKLEYTKRRHDLDRKRREILEEQERRNFEDGLGEDNARLQMQLREDRVNEEIMREREEEVRNINKGMHQVNEIYKDLANIISSQQDQVDEVEEHMEEATKHAESGLTQIQKANAKSEQSCVIT